MNVQCTQSKQCKIMPIDLPNEHTVSHPIMGIYRCKHILPHIHTPDCETKCCNQIGIVKCRIVEA